MKMFHVSRKDLGESAIFEVGFPLSDASKEHNEARVCFSPSVRQCLRGIAGFTVTTEANVLNELMPFNWKPRFLNPTVYETTKKLVKAPTTKSDFSITEEHWSLKDIKLKRVGYIDLRTFMLQHKDQEIPITKEPYSKFSKGEFEVWQASEYKQLRSVITSQNLKLVLNKGK
jgi:hypothetical protein